MTQKRFVLTLAVLALALTANRATAGIWIGETLPGWYVTYVPQKATYWQVELDYRTVEMQVEEPTYHTETRRVTVTVLEENFRDEEHVGTFHKYVPRTSDVEVTRCRMVPMTMTEPLTGCGYTICRPEWYTEWQQRITYDYVAERQKFTVRVSYFKPVEKTYEQDVTVVQMVPKTVTVRQPFRRLVPTETEVLVPVLAPAGFPVTVVPCCK
jgi:hypothetical protein